MLSILYRGPLSSCNYDCHYCPFAKTHNTAAELRVDRQCLERFCDWVKQRRQDQLGILFTPWGEALTRRWYQEQLVRLSQLDHVVRVAIQTNLSCNLDWLETGDLSSLALWCTWHPTQVARERFVGQCQRLDRLGVRYSVGVVGLLEDLDQIDQLRQELSPDVYLWINAYKRQESYYSRGDVQRLEAIDPLFAVNNTRHASFGRSCRAGESVISVDGDGNVRRCHFIDRIIANIYDPNFESCLRPRACSNATCGCHIGYVHLEHLQLDQVFGDGVLERIPTSSAVHPVFSAK